MIYWKNQPLAIAAHLAGSIEALAALPRPTFPASTDRKAATLELTGVLDPDYLADWRSALLSRAASDSVSRIVILADSPGGLVFGVPETAAVVKRVAKLKPVDVVAQNYLASGAYWIAAHATSITATPSTYVGSLGVLYVLLDESAAAEMMGVKVLKIASSEAKGAGVPGTPIEAAHVAMFQRLVDHTAAAFAADVERGRKFKPAQTAKVFNGEVWHGEPAKRLGLVDNVAIFEERVAELVALASPVTDYVSLRGEAAVAKFHELVAAEGASEHDLYAWNAAAGRVSEQYPQLAAAVDAVEA